MDFDCCSTKLNYWLDLFIRLINHDVWITEIVRTLFLSLKFKFKSIIKLLYKLSTDVIEILLIHHQGTIETNIVGHRNYKNDTRYDIVYL